MIIAVIPPQVAADIGKSCACLSLALQDFVRQEQRDLRQEGIGHDNQH